MAKGMFDWQDAMDKRDEDMEEFDRMLAGIQPRRGRDAETGGHSWVGGNKDVLHDRAKKAGRSISILGQIFNPQKIGRHGAKKLSEKNDSIKKLGDTAPTQMRAKTGAAMGMYFDPFGDVLLDRERDTRPEEIRKLNLDFLKRVEAQRGLARKNDFEKGRYGKLQQDYVVASMISKYGEFAMMDEENLQDAGEEYAKQFNQGRTFKKDYEGVDEIPDNFALVVAVDPPTDVYMDFNKDRAARTLNIFGQKLEGVDHLEMLDENMRKSADYREIVERGQRDAAETGMQYDPNCDPNVAILRTQILHSLTDGQGHSFVRMVAKSGNDDVHSYSFGFVPLTFTPGMGAVTMGKVENPDGHAKDARVIERSHPVSYANYLRAATKIRGLVGSKRTYSFMGYNCTSFAADVASEAGIPIRKEDSGERSRTFRRRKVWVDSPYSLAKYVRSVAPEAKGMNGEVLRSFEQLSFAEKTDAGIVTNLLNQFIERDIARDDGKQLPEDQVSNGEYGFNGEEYTEKTRFSMAGLGTAVNSAVAFTTMSQFQRNPAFGAFFAANCRPGETEGQFAESRVMELLEKVSARAKRIEEEMDTRMKTLNMQYFTPDRIAEERSRVIRERREKMVKEFGVPTAAEFISRVCRQEDYLNRAMSMMHWEIDHGMSANRRKSRMSRQEYDSRKKTLNEMLEQGLEEVGQADEVFDVMMDAVRASQKAGGTMNKTVKACGVELLESCGILDKELDKYDKMAAVAYVIALNDPLRERVEKMGNDTLVSEMEALLAELSGVIVSMNMFHLQNNYKAILPVIGLKYR